MTDILSFLMINIIGVLRTVITWQGSRGHAGLAVAKVIDCDYPELVAHPLPEAIQTDWVRRTAGGQVLHKGIPQAFVCKHSRRNVTRNVNVTKKRSSPHISVWTYFSAEKSSALRDVYFFSRKLRKKHSLRVVIYTLYLHCSAQIKKIFKYSIVYGNTTYWCPKKVFIAAEMSRLPRDTSILEGSMLIQGYFASFFNWPSHYSIWQSNATTLLLTAIHVLKM